MKKIITFLGVLFSLFAIRFSLFATTAYAVCPVCTVAVAGGLGLSRYLGVDDTISGIWIGGLILSSSSWFYSWISKKYPKLHSTFYLLLTTILMYLLTLGPLAWKDIIGYPFNTIWGIDKLIVGAAVGTLAFWVSLLTNKKVRKLTGKQLFNYQKIVFPLFFLVIFSFIMYFVTK